MNTTIKKVRKNGPIKDERISLSIFFIPAVHNKKEAKISEINNNYYLTTDSLFQIIY